jgi:hypothetical protein
MQQPIGYIRRASCYRLSNRFCPECDINGIKTVIIMIYYIFTFTLISLDETEAKVEVDC